MAALNKFEKLLRICFYIVFACFPLCFGLAMGGKHLLFGTYEEVMGTDTLYNWPILCIAFFMACLIALAIFYRKGLRDKVFGNISYKKMALIVLFIALAIRLAFFLVFKSALIPFSDGNHVWTVAHTNDDIYLNLKSTQNGWNNFMGIVVFLVRNFNVPYPVFILMQFIADAFIAFAVFKLAYEVFDSKDIAFWAGFFYAVNPVALMRMFYFSPECYSLLCLTFAAYTFVLMMKSKTVKPMYITALITGIILGVGNSLKSISIIFIVAVFIIVVLKLMAGEINKQLVLSWVMTMIIMLVPAMGINKLALNFTTAVTGVQARDLLLYHQLNVGLNIHGVGNTDAEDAWYYSHLIQAGVEPDVARDMLFEKLEKDWSVAKGKGSFWPWMQDKLEYTWTQSTSEFTMLMNGSIRSEHNTVQHYVYVLMLNIATSFMQISYVLLMLLSLIGVLYVLKKYLNNNGAMLISLYIFGFSLVMMAIESQPRYKSNFISFLCILAAVGIYELINYKKTQKNAACDVETV